MSRPLGLDRIITINCRSCGKLLFSAKRKDNLSLRLQVPSPLRCPKCGAIVCID